MAWTKWCEWEQRKSQNVLGGVAGMAFSEHLGLTGTGSNSGDQIQIQNTPPLLMMLLKRLVTAHFLSCPLLSFPFPCFEGPIITCWLQTCQAWQACWLEWVWAHSVCSCPREMPPFIANLLVRLPICMGTCVDVCVYPFLWLWLQPHCKMVQGEEEQKEVKLLFLQDLYLRMALNHNTCIVISIVLFMQVVHSH